MKGSLQIRNNKYYAVFRVNGNKNPTWFCLGIEAVTGNKRKAQKAMAELVLKYQNNKTAYNNILFTDYMEKWLSEMNGVIKPSTYETYETTVNKKIIPYFKDKGYKLSELKGSYFTEYFKFLKKYGSRKGTGLGKKECKKHQRCNFICIR